MAKHKPETVQQANITPRLVPDKSNPAIFGQNILRPALHLTLKTRSQNHGFVRIFPCTHKIRANRRNQWFLFGSGSSGLGVVLWLIFGIFMFAQSSCAPASRQRDPGKDVRELLRALKKDPGNNLALGQLGVALFEVGRFERALGVLTKANERLPNRGKTLFYLGLTVERMGDLSSAQTHYAKFEKVPRNDRFRKILEGRFHEASRMIARDEIKRGVYRERDVTTMKGGDLSANAVAVLPFRYVGEASEFAYLGRGLSEMITTDLSQVPGIRLVERVRLQELIRERRRTDDGIFDPSTALRNGALLGAGRLIGGSYSVNSSRRLRLDVASWDIRHQHYPEPTTKSDRLSNLYTMQKDVVFRLIDEMGIALTPAERRRIQTIPTKNLRALLAYSRGLELEDRGRFADASALFQQATNIDPGFEAARKRTATVQGRALASGSITDITDKIKKTVDVRPQVKTPDDLLGSRLQILTTNLGANFVPGEDSREYGEIVRKPLLSPPPPPTGVPDD